MALMNDLPPNIACAEAVHRTRESLADGRDHISRSLEILAGAQALLAKRSIYPYDFKPSHDMLDVSYLESATPAE